MLTGLCSGWYQNHYNLLYLKSKNHHDDITAILYGGFAKIQQCQP